MATPKINVTTAKSPSVSPNFTLLQAQNFVGPTPVIPPGQSAINNATPPAPVVSVATWTPMTVADSGLKAALIKFIDTTKDGTVYPTIPQGRTKVMNFQFFGTASQTIAPGEIGEFTLSFSYPPGGNSVSSNPTAVNLSSIIN